MTAELLRKALRLVLWALALLLAGRIVLQLPMAGIGQSLAALTALQWLPWLLLNVLIILIFTQRWRVLATMLGMKTGFWRLLQIRQAGQAVSFITPGPQFGGEPLQVWWLYKLCRVPLHKAVLALGLDRLLELWVNFAVLLLGVLFLLVSPALAAVDWLRTSALLAGLLALLTSLCWLVLRQPRWLAVRLERLARHWQRHPRLLHLASHWNLLRDDLQQAVATRKPALLKALLLSLLGWALLLGEFALLLGFFALHLDIRGFTLIIVALRLAFLLPLPGAIGALEAALFWSFQLLDLPAAAALGAIALMRLRDAVVLGGGLLCLRMLQMRKPNLDELPAADAGSA
jgi:hypothetical protein